MELFTFRIVTLRFGKVKEKNKKGSSLEVMLKCGSAIGILNKWRTKLGDMEKIPEEHSIAETHYGMFFLYVCIYIYVGNCVCELVGVCVVYLWM